MIVVNLIIKKVIIILYLSIPSSTIKYEVTLYF